MSRFPSFSPFCSILLAACCSLAFADGPKGSRVAKVFESLQAEQESIEKQNTGDTADIAEKEQPDSKSTLQQATFGNGCFWCTEAVFQELVGVRKVISGYSGGRTNRPTYKQVCTGRTGHAEVIHLEYDPKLISFEKLLEVFWRTHDPTTLNRQGNDYGTQYRSAVFYHNEEQMKIAKHFKTKLNKAKAFGKPVVTEITKFKEFFPAERYHQDYFRLHGRAPYCRAIIKPKMSKFRRVFADELARNPKNADKKRATP